MTRLHHDTDLGVSIVAIDPHVRRRPADPLTIHESATLGEGSEHQSGGYFGPLQEAGALLNGSTSTDRTNYWELVPKNAFRLALWMEADRMGWLLPALSADRFDTQRGVVLNERRQSYENRPYGLAQFAIMEAMFPSSHPYSWPTIGRPEDLAAATLDDVRKFFVRYYHPGNASLAIAGDVLEGVPVLTPPGAPTKGPARLIDLIGVTDLTMLMGVISYCSVVVANDSGALHLAGALGVKAVGIYGPTDERYSAPITPYEDAHSISTLSEDVFCRPCFLADCPIDHRCMKRIPTERVYDAVRRFLQESPS